MAKYLLRCAVIYALVGISMGVMMGATHDFSLRSVHVHINLLGWVSMAVMAMCYRLYPSMAQSVLAKAQFWLHNIGLPVMMAGLYALLSGRNEAEPAVAIGSVVMALAFVAFAINVWRNAMADEVDDSSPSQAQRVVAPTLNPRTAA